MVSDNTKHGDLFKGTLPPDHIWWCHVDRLRGHLVANKHIRRKSLSQINCCGRSLKWEYKNESSTHLYVLKLSCIFCQIMIAHGDQMLKNWKLYVANNISGLAHCPWEMWLRFQKACYPVFVRLNRTHRYIKNSPIFGGSCLYSILLGPFRYHRCYPMHLVIQQSVICSPRLRQTWTCGKYILTRVS